MNARSDRFGSFVVASIVLSTAMLTGCGENSSTVQNSVTPTVEPSAITSSPSLSPNATSPNSGKGKKPQAAVRCAADEPIKARVTPKDRKIYVEPGAPNYDRFRTTQCFKTVAEAQKAGYQEAAVACVADEPIKGRVTPKGRKIYVEPGAANYDRFRATQCFKTVAEAQKAGYQARKPAAPQQLDDSNG
ncbi:MAG TPA: hypothetical protein V6D19_20850 [Stenomitos sp.]